MKKRRIYHAPGLLELRLRCAAGGATLRVDFTGGRTVGNMVRWARFETDDDVVARIIEESGEFKRGRIALLWSHAY